MQYLLLTREKRFLFSLPQIAKAEVIFCSCCINFGNTNIAVDIMYYSFIKDGVPLYHKSYILIRTE